MTIPLLARRHAGHPDMTGPRADPGVLSVRWLTALVRSPLARCAGSGVNPDEWFPIATRPAAARVEAARALALCAACPVRAECLELSLRAWHTGGQHGIWGGFVEADRAIVRNEWLAGVPAAALTVAAGDPQGHRPPSAETAS